MIQTIAFEPGGVELAVVELNGAIDFSLRLRLALVDGFRFLAPTMRVGFDPDPPEGLFYVPPIPDQIYVPEVPDLFSVAGLPAVGDNNP